MSENTAPLDYDQTASEILEDALRRVQLERTSQAEWVAECRENLRFGLEMLRQAEVAEAGLQALIASEAFAFRKEAAEDEPRPVVTDPAEPAAVFPQEAPQASDAEIAEASEPQDEPPPPAALEPAAVEMAPPEPAVRQEPEPPPAPSEPVERKTLALKDRTHSRGEVAGFQAEDDARLLAALRQLAGDRREVQASLSVLAKASTIPHGSVSFVVRRLVDAGRIEVQKNTREGSRTPAPSTYRFLDAAPKRAPLADLPHEPAPAPKPGRAIRAADCPATPAPAPSQPLRIPVEFDEVWLTPEGPPGSLAALRAGDCKWPTNTPPAGAGHLTTFCAAFALEGGPYCQAHADRARGRGANA